MSETRKPIVIVGSITMDLVTRTPRIPAIGQTLIGTGFETTPGRQGREPGGCGGAAWLSTWRWWPKWATTRTGRR